jgi:hypothetical protein
MTSSRPDRPVRSPSTSVPSGFLPDRAERKRAEKGTSTLPVEGLRMSRPQLRSPDAGVMAEAVAEP